MMAMSAKDRGVSLPFYCGVKDMFFLFGDIDCTYT